MNNELESLLVDGSELDKKLVAEVLSPYLRIDERTCSIRPEAAWNDLKAYLKIVLYLLARKAMVALGLDLKEESAAAVEIMKETGLKKGTVNPALRMLYDDRVVEQTEGRRYYIPNHAIGKIKGMVIEKTI